MARNLTHILVIDVEATCWQEKIPPEGMFQEIIEVGICMVDLKTFEITDKESILVKPQNSNISSFCTKLTSITHEKVENLGISFEEACHKLLKKYDSRDTTWASWGDYDRIQFEKQCKRLNIPYPFGPTHINVKNLFSIVYKQEKEVGMKKALQVLGLELDGIHHRGVDDAYNISKILVLLINKNHYISATAGF